MPSVTGVLLRRAILLTLMVLPRPRRVPKNFMASYRLYIDNKEDCFRSLYYNQLQEFFNVR